MSLLSALAIVMTLSSLTLLFPVQAKADYYGFCCTTQNECMGYMQEGRLQCYGWVDCDYFPSGHDGMCDNGMNPAGAGYCICN
jgi:hypothetical protein